MRVVFMGTPDFAVPVLDALLESRHQVAGVVTQPDRRKGRGKAVAFTPVKERAAAAGLLVCQPEKIRKNADFFQTLTELAPDVIVVAAFGQILPKEILELPRYGCINVHASLLPKLRGAAPIQWAVMEGEDKSGITIMQMNEGLDTGDMLLKREVLLDPWETGGSLHDKLMELGGPLLLEALDGLEKGTLVKEKQPKEGGVYAKMLTKELGRLDFERPAKELERKIRGLNPWPSAYTCFHGKTLKLWKVCVEPGEALGKPGEIVRVEKDTFWIAAKDGALSVWELQLEGKKRVEAADFLRGYALKKGEMLPS